MDFFRGFFVLMGMTVICHGLNLLFIAMKMPEVYPAIIIAFFITILIEIIDKINTLLENLKKV